MGLLPGFGRDIREGVGTLMMGMFTRDAKRRARDLQSQLQRDALAAEFAQTAGWRIMAGRYSDYIAGLTARQLDLGKKARDNAHEIERISDSIDNANMLLRIASDAITKYESTRKEYDKQDVRSSRNQGTAA